jgi:hypothetical protein
VGFSIRGNQYIESAIFRNFDVAIVGYGSGKVFNTLTGTILKIMDCNTAFGHQSARPMSIDAEFSSVVVLKNVKYFIEPYASNIRISLIGALNGAPTIQFVNTAGIFKSQTFKVLDGSFCLNIPNVYPEYQQALSSTLANNATDSVSVGNKSYSRTIELKANITRGTNYQYKRITILNSGTALTIVQQPDSLQTADLGVRIDGAYYSGTSAAAVIKLKWHTTNTGTAATFKYDAIRQNY